ncbi:MAG TPA: hypothetical protein VJT09_02495 [Pyrinomonadaceae bacterium]|nr:hypothetical protein [Pyrinomonadaceae bacterium]
MSQRKNIVIPREVLLVEIERRCRDEKCNGRTRVGLTKEEARLYCGFECEHCGEKWEDALTERDVPEWWEELTITGLYSLRESRRGGADNSSEVVERMSDNYRRELGRGGEGEDSI